MEIAIYYAPAPRNLQKLTLSTTPNTPIGEALPSELVKQIATQDLSIAVFGRMVDLTYPLKMGDRIELLRPLRVDPMTARRERFNRQGAKKAGLFKTRRKGAKPGY